MDVRNNIALLNNKRQEISIHTHTTHAHTDNNTQKHYCIHTDSIDDFAVSQTTRPETIQSDNDIKRCH